MKELRKKKKIAFILPALNAGGAERVTLSIIKALDKEKYAPVLITFSQKGPLRNEIPSSVRLYSVDGIKLRYSVIRLMKLLAYLQVDCIFSTLDYMNFAILILKRLFRLKARIVIRESSTPSRFLERYPGYKARLYKLLYRLLYPGADLIIAQCDNMRQDLIKHFGIRPAKIVRIYNPVDTSVVLAKANAFFPEVYKHSKVNIVAVGRLAPAKGYDLLLKAFRCLLDYEPKAHLYIIGEGPLKTELTVLCRKLRLESKVSFLGYLDNPYPYIRHADLYVLSSRWEGFPNTLLEALVCGAKVVATDCDSGPREILGDEKYGMLAGIDELSLCRKMRQYLKADNRTSNRGSDFSLEKIIVKYQRAFDRVLS